MILDCFDLVLTLRRKSSNPQIKCELMTEWLISIKYYKEHAKRVKKTDVRIQAGTFASLDHVQK